MTSAHFENREETPVFLTQMDRLLLPAWLLTGSHEQAADCLLEAYDHAESTASDAAHETFDLARRSVVKAALKRIAADVAKWAARLNRKDGTGADKTIAAVRREDNLPLDSKSFVSALQALNAFQRAALVLRRYERYSPEETAALLDVSHQTLQNGLQQALVGLLGALSPASSRTASGTRRNSSTPQTCCWQQAGGLPENAA